MSITAIILLILLGIFLFIVEFLLVPGITIAGIGGAIVMAIAVYLPVQQFRKAPASKVWADSRRAI